MTTWRCIIPVPYRDSFRRADYALAAMLTWPALERWQDYDASLRAWRT